MSNTALDMEIQGGYQEPYFDRGYYLCKIVKPKLNARGEPYLSLNVQQSFDGRRINSYYCINFFLKSKSDKQRILWTQKIKELIRASGLKSLKDMAALDQMVVTVFFSKAGYSPLPSFQPQEMYDKVTTSPVTPIYGHSAEEPNKGHSTEGPDINVGYDDAIWLDEVPF